MWDRLPRPWKLVEGDEAYWIEAANGAQFGFCYFDEREIGTGRNARLTREAARRAAANFARLPDLLDERPG